MKPTDVNSFLNVWRIIAWKIVVDDILPRVFYNQGLNTTNKTLSNTIDPLQPNCIHKTSYSNYYVYLIFIIQQSSLNIWQH